MNKLSRLIGRATGFLMGVFVVFTALVVVAVVSIKISQVMMALISGGP